MWSIKSLNECWMQQQSQLEPLKLHLYTLHCIHFTAVIQVMWWITVFAAWTVQKKNKTLPMPTFTMLTLWDCISVQWYFELNANAYHLSLAFTNWHNMQSTVFRAIHPTFHPKPQMLTSWWSKRKSQGIKIRTLHPLGAINICRCDGDRTTHRHPYSHCCSASILAWSSI